ncbi:hypothetical protein CTA1_8471 [Colletotrichum tanaceti]|uniref:Uncharacterized protein n=1 Tax=Colletotrichum tanaceti TaxID=1306861 RepID=A0A4U6XBD3_9PEZI|nr:hypothetical protein CTA1_8471 [Colletotrichum tanaceti]
MAEADSNEQKFVNLLKPIFELMLADGVSKKETANIASQALKEATKKGDTSTPKKDAQTGSLLPDYQFVDTPTRMRLQRKAPAGGSPGKSPQKLGTTPTKGLTIDQLYRAVYHFDSSRKDEGNTFFATCITNLINLYTTYRAPDDLFNILRSNSWIVPAEQQSDA